MTDYEVGYLQALRDIKATAERMVQDLSIVAEEETELKEMVSFLDVLIEQSGDGVISMM